MAKVPNAVEKLAENFNRLIRAHERYRRQADGRAIAYSEREREFTFVKNDILRKKLSSHKVRGVSPEAERGSMMGKICERFRS